jgi:hypothetical protein
MGHLRVVHQFARQSALQEEFLAIIEQLLGGFLRLFGGIDVGLCFDYRLGNLCGRDGAQVGFGLGDLRLAFRGAGGEIAAFQDGEQLALLDVVAALHEEALHGRRDLGHHRSLVAREEHAISRDDAANCVLRDGGHLDGRGRFRLRFLLFGTGGQQEDGDEQERFVVHGLEGPR